MQIANMPDTCTARHFYAFPYDHNHENSLTVLREQLKMQLDEAKRARIVNVFAFLIGRQEKAGAVLLEFGFVCSSDLHNYKYPQDSRRLKMYVRDMNSWQVGAAAPVVNAFAATPAATPAAAPRRGAGGRFVPREHYVIPEGRSAGWIRHTEGDWTAERLIAYYMHGNMPGRAAGAIQRTREQAIQYGVEVGNLVRF